MKNAITMTVIVGLMSFGAASTIQAQNQLTLVQDVHVNPGKTAQYEEARLGRNTRMADAGVTFGSRTFANDRNIFSTLIPLLNMADLDTRRTELSNLAAGNSTLASRLGVHANDTKGTGR